MLWLKTLRSFSSRHGLSLLNENVKKLHAGNNPTHVVKKIQRYGDHRIGGIVQFVVELSAVSRIFVHVALDKRPLTSDNQADDAFIKRLFKSNDLVGIRTAVVGNNKMLLSFIEQPDAALVGRYPLKTLG